MIREVIATGRGVDEAIDNGCAELGIERADAEFEIISLQRKGFLGLKTYPAKVRIYQELPDPVVKPTPKPAPPRPAPRPGEAAGVRPVAPEAPKAKPQQPQQAKPQPQLAKPQQPKPQPAAPAVKPGSPAPAPKRPAPNAGAEARPATAPAEPVFEENYEPAPQVEVEPTPQLREKVEKAAQYLADIMRAMGFDTIEVTPAYYTESVCLRLSGAQLGVVIGRRGETLDALQYLTSLVANRGDGDYIRINIDSGNYREKREKTLTALARKLALQAVRTGKSTTLEPMNPYERRVIHGAVSQIRGAVSTSVGADPNRRVVISVADPAKRTGEAPLERGDRTGRSSGRGGDRRGRERGPRPAKSNTPLIPNTNKPFTPGEAAPRREPTPLRPNTNTVASAAAAPIGVKRVDDGSRGHTATFAAARAVAEKPADTQPMGRSETVAIPMARPSLSETAAIPMARPSLSESAAIPSKPSPNPAPQRPNSGVTPPPQRKLSDAEMFGDIPIGVPILSGDRPATPKPAYEPKPKPAPKKLDGELYGKI